VSNEMAGWEGNSFKGGLPKKCNSGLLFCTFTDGLQNFFDPKYPFIKGCGRFRGGVRTALLGMTPLNLNPYLSRQRLIFVVLTIGTQCSKNISNEIFLMGF
jgi:hypothetical protein